MSGFYTVGETKIRPGVYHRYENSGGAEVAGARSGVGLALVSGNWGALNTPVSVDNSVDVATVIGSGSGANVVTEMINGGVEELVIVRVGSGGTEASITLKDNASTGVAVVTLTAKYPGDRAFSITVKESLDDTSVKEATIYEGTKALEKVTFAAGTTEVDAIVEAFADSSYVYAKKTAEGSGTLADVQQASFTAGTNPTVDTETYSAAASAAEAEQWDLVCTDSELPAVHNVIHAFIQRTHNDGNYPMMVVGESGDTDLDTRIAHAMAFNDEKVVYVLNSWEDSSETVYGGYLAAARIGGMICSGSASESLTHTVITGAAKLSEGLTNAQIKTALKSGCLVLSLSKTKQVQIEKAINTLVTLDSDQDAGWKKIRRVKERFELMDRIDTTLEPMIGKVDNDTDGRAAIIAAAQRVIDAMIGEKKLLAGTVSEDSSNPAQGDSAWFILAIDDLDSLETIYLLYQFRFAADTAEA